MGTGLSAELGKDSLLEETTQRLERTLKLLRANDPDTHALDLSNCGVGAKGCELGGTALANNTSLQELDLSYNNLTAAGMTPLVESLNQNRSLRRLNLSGNAIGDEGATILAEYLAQDPPLEELVLFHNGITDAGICELINGLQPNSHLVFLNLSMNEATAKTLIMLNQLLEVNTALSHVALNGNPINLEADPKRFVALENDVQNALAKNEERVLKARQTKEILDQKAARRALKEEEAKAEQAKAQEESDQRIAAEIQAREEDQRQEAAYHQQLEHEMEVKRRRQEEKAARNDPQARAQRAKEWTDRAMEQAYQWRGKLSNNGNFVKEWRNGFTVMTTAPGDPPGAEPRLSSEIPRRLKACWCDPQDATAPYARTLHYHCKYEKEEKDEDKKKSDGDAAPKYRGCCGEGHTCATIGFYAKPLPNLSAANFFASAHPAPPVDLAVDN